jgi:hypothetical protein
MNRLLAAAKAHYAAQRDESIANLEIYLTKSVGIGEHSDLQVEIRRWTDSLAAAVDSLEALERFFTDDGKPRG